MADQINDIVGRDNLKTGVSSAIDDIIAAKLVAKKAEAEREAAEEASGASTQNRSGGVTFGPGCVVHVGGKIYQKDNQ